MDLFSVNEQKVAPLADRMRPQTLDEFLGQKHIVGKGTLLRRAIEADRLTSCIFFGPPGVGKTTLAISFAKTLGLETKRVQFTSDTMPSDIIGFSVYNKASGAFEYKAGAVMTNLLLADEINRTSSKTQSALLEAMEEYQITVDGKTHKLPSPFVVIATQNPVGSAGTQLLPSSQLDRFLIRTSMGYPDVQSQISILRDRHHENPLDKLKPVLKKEELEKLIAEAEQVFISDPVYEYVVRLVQATRESELVELGVSPRGALALCRMAKACAFVRGFDFVRPEDVAEVFSDVCAHRLVLSAKARLQRREAEDVAQELLRTTDMPQIQEG